MFISKEKYAAAMQQIAQLELSAQEKDQRIALLEKQLEDTAESTSEDTRAQEELQGQIEDLSARLTAVTSEKDSLTVTVTEKQTLIDQNMETINDLKTTIEKINGEAAEQSATAISQSDAQNQGDNLVQRIKENAHDTALCMDYLREAGF